jgi:hypothetical protein
MAKPKCLENGIVNSHTQLVFLVISCPAMLYIQVLHTGCVFFIEIETESWICQEIFSM